MDIGLPERRLVFIKFKKPFYFQGRWDRVTGYSTPDLHQDALNAGCAAVLVKPGSLDALREALDKYFPTD